MKKDDWDYWCRNFDFEGFAAGYEAAKWEKDMKENTETGYCKSKPILKGVDVIKEILESFHPYMKRHTDVIAKRVEKIENEKTREFIAFVIGGMMDGSEIERLSNKLSGEPKEE